MWTVFWLAFTFTIHIVMVNIGIFLSIYVPLLKRAADRSKDGNLDKVAYKLMRFYAATYGVAGVMATAFTVFLLSFYPGFIGLAGNLALIPFGLAILMIALHFLSITGYYYGWYRWSRGIHNLFGALLALSAVFIPFGFRTVFSFLNIPVGLQLEGGRLSLNVVEALKGNPTFWPLYLKSLTAAVTAGSFAVIGGLAFSYARSPDEAYKSAVARVVKHLATVTAVCLGLMLVLGLWYALSLETIPYKFNNVFAGLGWRVGEGPIGYDVSWVFALKMLLYAFQIAVIATLYARLRSGVILDSMVNLLLAGGFAALVTVGLGELLNAFSHYPYFIACLGSPTPSCQGILSQIPQNQLPRLAEALSLEHYNRLATIGSVEALTIGFMVFLIALSFYFLYFILTGKK